MSLRSRLRSILRPWHAVLFAVTLVGTARSLRGRPLEPFPVLAAVASGLFVAVVFQFTVGNLWAYAVEYRNAGGGWTDLPFVAPFAAGVVGGAVTYAFVPNLGAAAWAAFWAFVLAACVVAVVVHVSLGYRDSAA